MPPPRAPHRRRAHDLHGHHGRARGGDDLSCPTCQTFFATNGDRVGELVASGADLRWLDARTYENRESVGYVPAVTYEASVYPADDVDQAPDLSLE